MADPNKEIHFSLTIGPLNNPHSAILIVDWGPEDTDVPTYCWQQLEGEAVASIANQPPTVSFLIQSGTHNPPEHKHPRKLRIPAWGVSGPNPLQIEWSDQDKVMPPRSGVIEFRPTKTGKDGKERGLCQSCPQPIP
jgi:hypothetical protein